MIVKCPAQIVDDTFTDLSGQPSLPDADQAVDQGHGDHTQGQEVQAPHIGIRQSSVDQITEE